MLDIGFLRRRRIRLARQSELAECGIACLAMISVYYGNGHDLRSLRRKHAPSMRGTTLRDLMDVAHQIGLAPRALKLPLENLDQLQLPAILHWDMNHFVVVERVKRGKALIHNPDGTSAWLLIDEISNHFTGIALELRPLKGFEPTESDRPLRISDLIPKIPGIKMVAVNALILSAIIQIISLISPYFLQISIDKIIPSLDLDLLDALAICFGFVVIFNSAAIINRSFVVLGTGSLIGFEISSNVAKKLFSLPLNWYSKRSVGDVVSRFQSVIPIQKAITEGAISSIIDGSLSIFTFFAMFIYSKQLAVVSLTAFTIYGAFKIAFFASQKQSENLSISYAAKEQTHLIETIRGISTLRSCSGELKRHDDWINKLAESVNAKTDLTRLGIWQNVISTTIFGIESVICTWLAVKFIIENSGFSIGMLFAFMSYRSQFIQKASSFIDQIFLFKIVELHKDRIADIVSEESDRGFQSIHGMNRTLEGRIELRNITYRYSPQDLPIFEDLNLVVEPGEHVAITGPSGGGKTTLAKIIGALTEPSSGALMIDGIPIDQFGLRNYRSQVGTVLQDDTLFAGSIAENISLFDEQVDMERVYHVAASASIHQDICTLPMGYETMVGDMGSSLSGGQVQRILLARALYRKPRILIIDEGTSHLDMTHESRVNDAISALGITSIVVAHRRETIEAADRFLELRDGVLRPFPNSAARSTN